MRECVERWSRSFFFSGTLDHEPGALPPRWWNDADFTLDDPPAPQGGELALQCWQNSWPIMVGAEALEKSIRADGFPRESKPQRLFNLMPFNDDVYAALACSAAFTRSIVTFFGLAILEYGSSGSPEAFRGGPAAFRIVGADPTSPDVGRYIDQSRRWWSQFGMQPILPGRPRGTPDRTLEDYRSFFTRCAAEGGGRISKQRFCERWGIPDTTLRRNLAAHGFTWSEFRRTMHERD